MRGAGYNSTGTLRAELLELAMCLFCMAVRISN